MLIYIAGRITGDPLYKEKFRVAEERLREQGHTVLNPAVLPKDADYEVLMRICMKMIDVSDLAYFLKDWNQSGGARREVNYCDAINKRKCFEGMEEFYE